MLFVGFVTRWFMCMMFYSEQGTTPRPQTLLERLLMASSSDSSVISYCTDREKT